jgi:hypothetical protein
VGGVKCLLSLVLYPDWCVSVLFQHVHNRVPGPTEVEATVSVDVVGPDDGDRDSP